MPARSHIRITTEATAVSYQNDRADSVNWVSLNPLLSYVPPYGGPGVHPNDVVRVLLPVCRVMSCCVQESALQDSTCEITGSVVLTMWCSSPAVAADPGA